ncbi:hypothetical protein H2203_003002 [Taxawa tesnikishii (nom. ined.)]|nr:hypothetical protein H2203_003002 [Dothideales sp. JES 119]
MSVGDLSAREIQLLVAVVKNSEIQTNWEGVASDANYNTTKVARDKWAIAKKKLMGASVNGGGTQAPATPASGKKTATSGKRKKTETPADDDTEETPSKKPAKGKGSRKTQPEATGTEDDDDDQVQAHIKNEQEEDAFNPEA